MTATNKKKQLYNYNVFGNEGQISVTKENYESIAGVLGLTATETRSTNFKTVSDAVFDGELVPIKLNMSAGTRRRQAHVFCSTDSVEAALNPTSGLKGKKYGIWQIDKAYCELDVSYVP